LVTISNATLRNHLTLWEQIKDPLVGTQNEYKRYRDDFWDVLIELGSMNNYGGAVVSCPDVDELDFPNTNKLILQSRKAGNIMWKKCKESCICSINLYILQSRIIS